MKISLQEALRFGNIDIDQINRAEVVCFACHDDLLSLDSGRQKTRIICLIPLESSVFFRFMKDSPAGSRLGQETIPFQIITKELAEGIVVFAQHHHNEW